MGFDSCWWVAVPDNADAGRAVKARAEALAHFYRPVGLIRTATWVLDEAGAHVGVLSSTRPELQSGIGCWGEVPPPGLSGPEELLTADDSRLRSIHGVSVLVGWKADRLRIVNSSSGPAGLYVAHGPVGSVWSTHAVAAHWIAAGSVGIDWSVLAEHIAFDFAGGERTLVQGSSTVPPGTRIDVHGGRFSERTYWPAKQRWKPLPEATASQEAARALRASLRARTSGHRAMLGLTAGVDSLVLALALQQEGVRVSAFTWGEADWPDPRGARVVADRLGIEHRVIEPMWLDGRETLSSLDRQSRWCDGVCALATAERTFPGSDDVWVAGMGGEIGRAFYWRANARLHPHPSRFQMGEILAPRERLGPADDVIAEQLTSTVLEWIDDARDLAHGWRALDVLYAEQRVRRWGRSQLPMLRGALVAGYTAPPLARALASLPEADRVSDGFARRYVAASEPKLVPPAPPPPPARRRLWRLRALARHLIPLPAEGPVRDELLIRQYRERPEIGEFLSGALADGRVRATLGARWCRAIDEGLARGERRAFERAYLLAGPYALAQALVELRSSSGLAGRDVS